MITSTPFTGIKGGPCAFVGNENGGKGSDGTFYLKVYITLSFFDRMKACK